MDLSREATRISVGFVLGTILGLPPLRRKLAIRLLRAVLLESDGDEQAVIADALLALMRVESR